MTETTELVRRDVTDVARSAWKEEQRELIRRTIAPQLTEPEFDLFLELAARYGLNPMHGEIWPAKMPGKNGEPGKFTPIVGRDGFLAIANRSPDFEGFDADVVREADTLRKQADGSYEHTFLQGPKTEGELGGERHVRGPIIGAYCVVYRRGRRPVSFYAPFGEYNSGNRAWRSNPSAMILKCAMANALRLAYNLSGLYVDAEMSHITEEIAPPESEDPAALYGDDEIGQAIRERVEAVNAASPGRYRPAKLRIMLANATDTERRAFAEALSTELAELRGDPAEEVVVEAEVVPEADESEADELRRMAEGRDPEDAAELRATAERLAADAA